MLPKYQNSETTKPTKQPLLRKMNTRTLDEQRREFANGKFLATPLAGVLVWTSIGTVGIFFSDFVAVWSIFIGTGSIVYLAMFISKYTGEDLLDESKPKNEFDTLFFLTVAQAVMVYAIAVPFFMIDYSSLLFTVGILTGLMWLPLSWIIQHWVGIFHATSRTAVGLLLWYLLPNHSFIAIPFAIVLIYLITIFILRSRKKTVITISNLTL